MGHPKVSYLLLCLVTMTAIVAGCVSSAATPVPISSPTPGMSSVPTVEINITTPAQTPSPTPTATPTPSPTPTPKLTATPVLIPIPTYKPSSLAPLDKAADLVLINGKIITVDAKDSIVEAVAVKNGKIVKVGTNQEVGELIGAQTDVLDLKGKTVTPGLVDAHIHPGAWFRYDNKTMDLGYTTSKKQILDIVASTAKTKAKGEWIVARPVGGEKPSRTELDAVAPDNPVYLSDFTMTRVTVNSLALTLAGIDKSSPDPPGGVIEKDASGELTGILINNAVNFVTRIVPAFHNTESDLIRYFENGIEESISEGKTYLRDAKVNVTSFELMKKLAMENKLATNMSGYAYIRTLKLAEDNLDILGSFGAGNYTIAGIKLEIDGTGAGDALIYDTSLPASNNAHAYFTQDDLNKIVSMYNKSGWQITIHVWGDKAIDMALDAFESALKEFPRTDHRHTLEHVIYPTRQQLERIKRLGVVLSAQPNYIPLYGDGFIKAVNKDYSLTLNEMACRMIPLKTILDLGIPLAFGTDNPEVPDLAVKWGFIGSVSRLMRNNGQIANSSECITVQQALRCYTMGSAYVVSQEKERGSLENGKIADIAVWSLDLYSVAASDLMNLKAEITIIGGKLVYKADSCTLALVKGSEIVTLK